MAKTSPAQFIREVRQELAKVTWPTRKETGRDDAQRAGDVGAGGAVLFRGRPGHRLWRPARSWAWGRDVAAALVHHPRLFRLREEGEGIDPEQAEQKGLAHLFEEILVPMEEVVEVRRGKKVAAERKFFPGYVLVRMVLNDETWSLVRNTAKVTGFLGPGGKPSPIPDHEAERIRNQIAGGRRAPQALDRLHLRRQCPRQRRPVRLVQRRGRGGRRGARAGSRCRSRSSAGPPRSSWSTRRSRSSSNAVIQRAGAPCRGAHGPLSQQGRQRSRWRRRSRVTSSCRCRPARPTRRRRSGRRWVSAA